MNNEEKILSILETMQTELANINSQQKITNDRLEKLEAGQAKLEDGQMTLKGRIDFLEELIISVEAKNAVRHLQMQEDINKFSRYRSHHRVK